MHGKPSPVRLKSASVRLNSASTPNASHPPTVTEDGPVPPSWTVPQIISKKLTGIRQGACPRSLRLSPLIRVKRSRGLCNGTIVVSGLKMMCVFRWDEVQWYGSAASWYSGNWLLFFAFCSSGVLREVLRFVCIVLISVINGVSDYSSIKGVLMEALRRKLLWCMIRLLSVPRKWMIILIFMFVYDERWLFAKFIKDVLINVLFIIHFLSFCWIILKFSTPCVIS